MLTSYYSSWVHEILMETLFQTQNNGLESLKSMFIFILFFKIEFRTSCTIKLIPKISWDDPIAHIFTHNHIKTSNPHKSHMLLALILSRTPWNLHAWTRSLHVLPRWPFVGICERYPHPIGHLLPHSLPSNQHTLSLLHWCYQPPLPMTLWPFDMIGS